MAAAEHHYGIYLSVIREQILRETTSPAISGILDIWITLLSFRSCEEEFQQQRTCEARPVSSTRPVRYTAPHHRVST